MQYLPYRGHVFRFRWMSFTLYLHTCQRWTNYLSGLQVCSVWTYACLTSIVNKWFFMNFSLWVHIVGPAKANRCMWCSSKLVSWTEIDTSPNQYTWVLIPWVDLQNACLHKTVIYPSLSCIFTALHMTLSTSQLLLSLSEESHILPTSTGISSLEHVTSNSINSVWVILFH